MAYKIINNDLWFCYGIDLIDSPYFFKKIKFSDLFKEVEESKSEVKKEKIKNDIMYNSILWNGKSIDDILDETFSADETNTEEKATVKNEVSRILEKTKQQQKIIENTIDIDKRLEEISNKIDISIVQTDNKDYISQIKKSLKIKWDKILENHLDILSKYKDWENLTWYDIWSITWSINNLFSSYFKSLFDEISKFVQWNPDKYDLNSDEWPIVSKLLKNQSLEIYEMFRFINRVQEYNHLDLIAQLEDQDNKIKFNMLKWFLDSESYWWSIKWNFYVVTLDQFRRFRNFYAHHNDEKNIERIMKSSNPEKMKSKFYSKFLWDLEEDWKWFLQFVMERVSDS